MAIYPHNHLHSLISSYYLRAGLKRVKALHFTPCYVYHASGTVYLTLLYDNTVDLWRTSSI